MGLGFNYGNDEYIGGIPGYSLSAFNSIGGVDPYLWIFQKTLFDYSFQSGMGFNSCSIFSGGMGGCVMPGFGMGDSYTPSSTSGKTKEERIANTQLRAKHDALKQLLRDYLNTFSDKNSTEYLSLKDDLNTYSSAKQENYDKLKEYYNATVTVKEGGKEKTVKRKDLIAKALAGTDVFSKIGYESTYTQMTSTAADLKKQITDLKDTTYSSVLSGESLKSDVDVLDLLGSLSSGGKNFVDFYDAAWSKQGIAENKKKSLNKLYKAIGNALKGRIESIQNSKDLSESTKSALKKILSANNPGASASYGYTKELMRGMYYWLRIAEAEIMDKKYTALNEDFKDDALLGEGAFVKTAKAGLKTEGFDVVNGNAAKQIFE